MTMKRKIWMLLAAFAAAGVVAPGCSEGGPEPDAGPGAGSGGDGSGSRPLFVAVRTADYESEGGPVAGDDAAGRLRACLFEQGRMTAVYDAADDAQAGVGFRLDRTTGDRLYVLSGDAAMPDLEALCQAGTTERECFALTAGTAEGLPLRFFSGHGDLTGAAAPEVVLTRGTARLDLRIRVVGTASVERLTLDGAALHTPLFGDEAFAPTQRGEVSFLLGTPCTEDTPDVARIYEQSGEGAILRAEAVVNGKRCEIEAELPGRILRNRIYVVTLLKGVADQEVRLTVEPWEEGGEAGLYPDFDGRIRVDAAASELPAGVSVSEAGDRVTLPCGRTELLLALDCGDELELLPVAGYPLTVEREADAAQGLAGLNRFRIRKSLYAPGMEADEVVLQFRRKGLSESYPEDRIVLHLEPNPVRLEGAISFDAESYAFDFGRYVDNELGRFTLPEGRCLQVEFGEDEDPWVKLLPADDDPQVVRVLGGWRPNDPRADGRLQAATLVVTDRTDASVREEYRISRRNYGLPVTWFHGVWWCKYNARGNSRQFEDQILSSADPAVEAGQSLFDYLRDCSPEEFRDLWGWAYQGDSGIGMQVVDDGGKLVMEGFSASASVHINKLPADALSPDGYELPTMEEFNRMFDATDYVWMMWSGSHTLRSPWEGHSLVRREQRRRNDVAVGSVQMADVLYARMWSPDFPDCEPVVWYGPGAQWNADGIQHSGHYNNILFAVCSPEGAGWYFSGAMNALYLQKNGAGTKDTRILRFKKSPVEYIYGV